jgi:hypothetical protein
MLELECDFEDELEAEDRNVLIPDDPAEEAELLVAIKEDATEIVTDCIIRFFVDKKMHYGGPIPQRLILSRNYIKLVANATICDCIDRAYEMLKNCGLNCESSEGLVAEDIRLVIGILEKCNKKHIQQRFAGGILLMYLEFCEGLDVDYIDLCR